MFWRALLLFLAWTLSASLSAQDDFDWLRDDKRTSATIKHFLQDQNSQTNHALESTQPLKLALLESWEKGISKATKPWLLKKHAQYKTEYVRGREVLLKKGAEENGHQVLLDITERKSDHKYYQLGAWSLNSDGTKVALAEDTSGTGHYKISILDLILKQTSTIAENVEPTVLWSTDSRSIFIIEKDLATLRSFKLVKISLRNGERTELYSENNPSWLVSAYPSSDERWAIVQSNNETSVEQMLLDLKSGVLSDPLIPRKPGLEYFADIANEQLYLNSNHGQGFAIWTRPLNTPSRSLTQLYQPPNNETIDNFYLFKSALVVVTSKNSEKVLRAIKNEKVLWKHNLDNDGTITWIKRNGDYVSDRIRLRSMSLIDPPTWSEVDVKTGKVSLLSSDKHPYHQPQDYVVKRIWAGQDKPSIPITLAYRKDKFSAKSPVILYVYGAYGVTMKPYFMPQIISLLDKGAIYAIAHVRGGGFMGEDWHHQGRGVNKQNAITDFHNTTQFLKTFEDGDRPILAIGGSAGATIVAAAINQKAHLYHGAVLQVPFVDVVNSMSDTSLPLSEQQYLEWGNPNLKLEKETMLGYDPYQNLTAQTYPPILVRIGYQDRRVPYWEGAKYIARLQALSTSKQPYLLRTDFESGHRPDKRNALTFQAEEYAFLLSLVTHSSVE